MTVNWDDLLKVAGESGLTPPPIGEYDVVIDKTEAKKSSTNKDMIKVWFRITSGPNQGRGGIINQFTLSPENPTALGFWFRDMDTLGLTEDYFKGHPSIAQIANDLVGRTCRIRLGHREFGGQMQANVERIMKSSEGNGTAPPTFPGAPTLPGIPTLPPAPGSSVTPPPPALSDDPPF